MDNLVFHPDRPEVLAVLGWKLSTLGDPISDLANNCMAYFLPPHFNALRGTERGKVTFDTRREEPEFRNRLAPAQRAQLTAGLITAGKGCGFCTIFPTLSFLPSLKNPPGWKHLSALCHGCPVPKFVSYLPPVWQILCHVLPVLVGTITQFMHLDLC